MWWEEDTRGDVHNWTYWTLRTTLTTFKDNLQIAPSLSAVISFPT